MTCGRCAKELEADSTFCRYCGAEVRPHTTPRRLTRIPAQARLGGVCAGVAAYLNADVALVRLAWVVLSIVPGAFIGGVIAYAIAWILLPEASVAEVPPYTGKRLVRSSTNVRVAGVCAGLAEYLNVDPTAVRLAWVILSIYPGALIGGAIAYLIAWLIIPPAPTMPLEPVHTSL